MSPFYLPVDLQSLAEDDEAPPRVAILGAGPVGLEAALYARYLGMFVRVFERGRICEHVRQWGHVQMFSPFGLNASPLGLAALAAQHEAYARPAGNAFLTGQEWIDQYLQPLADSDLLADCLESGSEVLAIARHDQLKGEAVGNAEARAGTPFRLLVRDAQGSERTVWADVVVDTTGVYGQPNWMGNGGAPARGEIAARPHLFTRLPHVLGSDRPRFAGRRTLLVGSGYSAATVAVALAALAKEAPGTHATWVTRRSASSEPGEPFPIGRIAGDRLPERDRLAERANRLAAGGNSAIMHFAGTEVESITFNAAERTFEVELKGAHASRQVFDEVVALVGYRPDNRLWAELQVHECYASGGPMKLAAALLGQASADCLEVQSGGPQTLLNPEPNFYILGSKSYGRSSQFLLRNGLEQIRHAFALIQGRPGLDLYAQFARQGQ